MRTFTFILILLGLAATVFSQTYPMPPDVSPTQYDRYSFTINGERIFLASGEFHYWRCPSIELWEMTLKRMRANGLNAVSIYFHWGFHSPARGEYDFSGIRDVERLLQMCEDIGLYVIARPGPYINAETDAGGLPDWLLTSNATMRANDPGYLAAVGEWWDAVVPTIARHQLHKGGNVILFQIENELGDGDPLYMQSLYKMTRDRGIDVPIFHNDSIAWAQYPYSVDVSGHDDYPAWFFCREPWTMKFLADITDEHEEVYRDSLQQTHIPMFEVEYQGGSIDYWGGPGYQACYNKLGPEFVDASIKSLIGEGTTAVNQYMFYGGTSWGYLGYPGVYTSYDYGAPLREWTNLGERYDASKRLMFFATAAEDVLSKTLRNMDLVYSQNPDVLFRVRENPDNGAIFTVLRNMDDGDVAWTELEIDVDGKKYPVPSKGIIELLPRATKILPANYPLPLGTLVYTSSEMLTLETQDDISTLVLWSERGDWGEALLALDAELTFSENINVETTPDGVQIRHQHGAEPGYALFENKTEKLLVMWEDRAGASKMWRLPRQNGTLLVQGGYFVETPLLRQPDIRLETRWPETLKFIGVPPKRLTLNGERQKLSRHDSLPIATLDAGSRFGTPELPAIGEWTYRAEPFEAAAEYDDSDWAPVQGSGTLNPDTHGMHHGFVWYRGEFTPTGKETALEIRAYHSSSIWINGTYLASTDETTLQSVPIPAGMLNPGEPNTLAILVESLGHDQGGEQSKRPIGLWTAQFTSDQQELRPQRYPITDSTIFSADDNWSPRSKELFYGGGGLEAAQPGATIEFTFTGTDLKIFGATGPDHGQADVFIDGHHAGTLDAYVKWVPGQKPLLFEIHGWDDGPHHGKIVISGKNEKSSGARVTIDAIEAASLQPAVAPLAFDWKLQGARDAEHRDLGEQGHFNSSGLYGERNGWYDVQLDENWDEPKALTADDEWVGWYRTQFSLDIPDSKHVPLGLQLDGKSLNDGKMLIFLNGWLVGRYWPDKGPQTKFFLHPGILNEKGDNTLALMLWRRSDESLALPDMHLSTWTVTQVHELILPEK